MEGINTGGAGRPPMGGELGGFRYTTECEIEMDGITPIDPTYHGTAVLDLPQCGCGAHVWAGLPAGEGGCE